MVGNFASDSDRAEMCVFLCINPSPILQRLSVVHEIGRMPIAYRGKDERVERVLINYRTSSLLALVQDAAEEPSTYCFSVYPGNKT